MGIHTPSGDNTCRGQKRALVSPGLELRTLESGMELRSPGKAAVNHPAISRVLSYSSWLSLPVSVNFFSPPDVVAWAGNQALCQGGREKPGSCFKGISFKLPGGFRDIGCV